MSINAPEYDEDFAKSPEMDPYQAIQDAEQQKYAEDIDGIEDFTKGRVEDTLNGIPPASFEEPEADAALFNEPQPLEEPSLPADTGAGDVFNVEMPTEEAPPAPALPPEEEDLEGQAGPGGLGAA